MMKPVNFFYPENHLNVIWVWKFFFARLGLTLIERLFRIFEIICKFIIGDGVTLSLFYVMNIIITFFFFLRFSK